MVCIACAAPTSDGKILCQQPVCIGLKSSQLNCGKCNAKRIQDACSFCEIPCPLCSTTHHAQSYDCRKNEELTPPTKRDVGQEKSTPREAKVQVKRTKQKQKVPGGNTTKQNAFQTLMQNRRVTDKQSAKAKRKCVAKRRTKLFQEQLMEAYKQTGRPLPGSNNSSKKRTTRREKYSSSQREKDMQYFATRQGVLAKILQPELRHKEDTKLIWDKQVNFHLINSDAVLRNRLEKNPWDHFWSEQGLAKPTHRGNFRRGVEQVNLSHSSVVRLFGITTHIEQAESDVCLMVHGCQPYFYIRVMEQEGVPLPPDANILFRENDLQNLADSPAVEGVPDALQFTSGFMKYTFPEKRDNYTWPTPEQIYEVCLRKKQQLDKLLLTQTCGTITSVDLVAGNSIMGFCGDRYNYFWKISFSNTYAACFVRKVLSTRPNVEMFEASVPFARRVLLDSDWKHACWLQTKEDATVFVDQTNKNTFHVHYNDLVLIPPNKETPVMDPGYRVLSFDIECASMDGSFPSAPRDPIITIAAHIWNTKHCTVKSTVVFQTGTVENEASGGVIIRAYPLGRDSVIGRVLLGNAKYWGFRGKMWGEFWKWLSDSWASDHNRPHIPRTMRNQWENISGTLPELHMHQLRSNPGEGEHYPTILPASLYQLAWKVATDRLDTERSLLRDFSALIRSVAPHFITGYNVGGFDIPYVFERALTLNTPVATFWSSDNSQLKVSTRTSNRRGNTTRKYEVTIPNIICVDLLPIIQKNYKLASYKLNAVAQHFLNDTKDEMPYKDITPFWRHGKKKRRRLVMYCAQDARLPARLWDQLLILGSQSELAKAVGVTLKDLLALGSGTQVLCLMLGNAHKWDRLIPFNPRDQQAQATSAEERDSQFQGATVLDPMVGVHQAVTTLDLAALYPSIIQSGNFCFTTDITGLSSKDIDALTKQKAVFALKDGPKKVGAFISQPVFGGILPTILESLGTARKRAKRMMREAKQRGDTAGHNALNARQLALKICANSCYGFCGSPIMKNLTVSSSVTFVGRQLLNWTKKLVEVDFVRQPSVDLGGAIPTVVYGDTDSVMVKFPPPPIRANAMLWATAMEKFINQKYLSRLDIEFETYYEKFVLYKKKRYAGLKCDGNAPENTPLKIATKGLEAQRRDSIPFLRRIMREVLDLMLKHHPKKAIERARQGARELLTGNVSPHELVLSAAFTRLDYSDEQPHVRLFIKQCYRNPRAAPLLGDRISFLLVAGAKKSKISSLAEDPLYAIQHNMPLAYMVYFKQKYSKPMCGLLEPLLKTKTKGLSRPIAMRRLESELFGSVINHVSVAQGRRNNTMGGLKSLLIHQNQCLGCCVPLPTNSRVCVNCKRDEEALLMSKRQHIQQQKDKVEKIWARCRKCVGSELIEKPSCANVSCDAFLLRIQQEKELQSRLHKNKWIDIAYTE